MLFWDANEAYETETEYRKVGGVHVNGDKGEKRVTSCQDRAELVILETCREQRSGVLIGNTRPDMVGLLTSQRREVKSYNKRRFVV